MKHKHILLAWLIITLLLGNLLIGCAVFKPTDGGEWVLPDGIYEGRGTGYRGAIHVLVRLENSRIAEIEIADSLEDRAVGAAAMDELLDQILEYNSTDLDTISGATETSKGFLEAVENAMMRARDRVR